MHAHKRSHFYILHTCVHTYTHTHTCVTYIYILIPAHKHQHTYTTCAHTGEPAEGSDGADVVLVVDPSLDNLLHLHARKQYTAPKGANSNPAAGSGGPKSNRCAKLTCLVLHKDVL
jgi:hypothetical protein